MSDGQSCKVGTTYDFNNNYIFDPAKKITRIECIVHKSECEIMQMNFYHHQQRLVAVGCDDYDVKKYGGRVEVFEIEDKEQLMGCELDFCTRAMFGVTWVKWRIGK